MDLTALAAMKTTLDAGFPEEAVVQLARVYLDALGRVAEAESRFTHFYLHDRMRAQGMSGTDLSAAMRSSGEGLLPLVEPMVLYFHRKGWVRALREDAVMHVQERMGLRDDVELPGQVHMTIAFHTSGRSLIGSFPSISSCSSSKRRIT